MYSCACPTQRFWSLGQADAETEEETVAKTGKASTPADQQDEDDAEGEEEATFTRDLERERAGTLFSKAKQDKEIVDSNESSKSEGGGEGGRRSVDDDDVDDVDDDSDSNSDSDEDEEEEQQIEEVAPAAEEKQTEAQEHHELSKVRLYTRLVFGFRCSEFSGKTQRTLARMCCNLR